MKFYKFSCTTNAFERMGWTGQRLQKPPARYENRWMMSVTWHYKSELILETPKSLGNFPGNCWQQTAFEEVPSSAIQSENMASEHKIVALLRGGNHLTLGITDQASNSFLNILWGVMMDAQWWYWIKKVYIATGFTDLRRGIDGLARIIRFQFHLNPYDKNTLFLFCGRRTDRIKRSLERR